LQGRPQAGFSGQPGVWSEVGKRLAGSQYVGRIDGRELLLGVANEVNRASQFVAIYDDLHQITVA
jgi:hypothetical protein